jgi:MFS transporter, PAT family, beta-lactamase induction signal transducer AmpG
MTPPMRDDNPPHPPPWLFGVTGIPYGVCGGFVATTMPFFARKAGISVENIGWYGTALMFPPVVQFLYAPIVDIGPKRKHWLIIVAAVGAACLALALTMPLPSRINSFFALAFAGQTISGLVGSCNGGLMAATLPDRLRGAAAGWLNVGNLTGGAIGAWLTLTLAQWGVPPAIVGGALAVLMTAPAIASIAVIEPTRGATRPAREIFRTLWRDVARVVRSRQGWTGVLFCLSPVGTAALLNYFSALAPDYRASDGMVAFINGPVNGLVTAVGSLVGGYVCDRANRRAMYLLSGALTALAGIAMAMAPMVPMTYAVGVSIYLLVAGFCYAAFSSVVLETIGKGGAAASTRYALFVSAGNCAIAYVGWIDTRFHHNYGARGLLGVDAGLNVLGIVALSALFTLFGAWKKRDATEEATP